MSHKIFPSANNNISNLNPEAFQEQLLPVLPASNTHLEKHQTATNFNNPNVLAELLTAHTDEMSVFPVIQNYLTSNMPDIAKDFRAYETMLFYEDIAVETQHNINAIQLQLNIPNSLTDQQSLDELLEINAAAELYYQLEDMVMQNNCFTEMAERIEILQDFKENLVYLSKIRTFYDKEMMQNCSIGANILSKILPDTLINILGQYTLAKSLCGTSSVVTLYEIMLLLMTTSLKNKHITSAFLPQNLLEEKSSYEIEEVSDVNLMLNHQKS